MLLNQDEAKELIKRKLKEYLVEKGIEIPTNGNFKCPIPGCAHAHGDRTPSSGFVPGTDETLVHCFKSGQTADIFHLFALERNLSLNGATFFNDVLPALAEHFGIEYEKEKLSKEAEDRYKMMRAYADAAKIVTSNDEITQQRLNEFAKMKQNFVGEVEHLEEVWTLKTAKGLAIGAIESFNTYKAKMLEKWDEEYLTSIELLNFKLFNPNNLIFTICNAKGNPIAFVARNLKYDKTKEDSQKFYNSHTSEIYKKGDVLYNFHNCRADCGLGPIYIFEGYGDCVTAWQAGLKNCCAIGATAFTRHHLDSLIGTSAGNYVLVMDGDDAGISAANRVIDQFCRGGADLTMRFVFIPDEMDGDEYIRQYDLEALLKLKQFTAFEWVLDHSNITDKTKFTDTMVDKIVSDIDNVHQYLFAKILSGKADIPLQVIMNEIDRRKMLKDSIKSTKIDYVVDGMRSRIQKGENAKFVIADSLNKIEEIESSFHAKKDPLENYEQDIILLKEKLLTQPAELGFKFGTTIDPITKQNVDIFPKLHKVLDGLPTYGSLISIGGSPGVGKTAFLRYLMFQIAIVNPDVRVIFMSIDDSKSKILQGLISVTQDLPLARVRKPRRLNEHEMHRWAHGWDLIREMKHRFIVFDAVDGTTTDHLEGYIKQSQNDYPDKKVIAILDNFHKLTDYQSHDPRIKNTICSERLKYIATKYDVPVFMTVELRKSQSIYDEPTILDLKDTVQISYDTDYVWLMHNDLHLNKDSRWVWDDPMESSRDMLSGISKRRPILKLMIAKNKETDYKGNVYFKFRDYMGQFYELQEDEESQYQSSSGQRLGDFKNREKRHESF